VGGKEIYVKDSVNFAFLIIPRSRTFPVADYPIAAIIVLTDDTRACPFLCQKSQPGNGVSA